MNLQLITTADGSHSIYVKELDEHYHSIHGAIQEALHVFINTGLKYLHLKKYARINILEVGFGTGLNTLLTFIEAEKLNIHVNYTSLEAFPLEKNMLDSLNYVELISGLYKEDQAFIRSKYKQVHTCEWEKQIKLSDYFTLHKIKNTLQEVKFESTFDLIFFDAFGPRVQPEMWSEELFSKIYESTNSNGCLVTYCAKGEVKRSLKKVGFLVETLPGPPRKREMVRGTKDKSP